ncbi:MBL fold metallo-hydrolase [bacterium]|nr:MBL fold metallo-hydrolase [bacterium]
MGDINVKFRGVRGSFPVAKNDFMNYGGNTSCVEINAGGHLIILDAGTGIVGVGDELMTNYISSAIKPEDRKPIKANIFVSHIHQDHLLGLTFFKPLHVKSSQIRIFGSVESNSSLKSDLSQLVFGKTFPIDLGDIACNFEINDIPNIGRVVLSKDGQPKLNAEIGKDDVVVSFYKSYVHPQSGVMVYRVSYHGKSVVYATDKECYVGGDKKFVQFARGCDLLIHDAQYTTEDYLNPYSSKQGFGHSTFDMAIETFKQTNAGQLAFFHYEPSYNDEKLDKIQEYYAANFKNVFMSNEGLELNI